MCKYERYDDGRIDLTLGTRSISILAQSSKISLDSIASQLTVLERLPQGLQYQACAHAREVIQDLVERQSAEVQTARSDLNALKFLFAEKPFSTMAIMEGGSLSEAYLMFNLLIKPNVGKIANRCGLPKELIESVELIFPGANSVFSEDRRIHVEYLVSEESERQHRRLLKRANPEMSVGARALPESARNLYRFFFSSMFSGNDVPQDQIDLAAAQIDDPKLAEKVRAELTTLREIFAFSRKSISEAATKILEGQIPVIVANRYQMIHLGNALLTRCRAEESR